MTIELIVDSYTKIVLIHEWIALTCISNAIGPWLYSLLVDTYICLLEESLIKMLYSHTSARFHNRCGQ